VRSVDELRDPAYLRELEEWNSRHDEHDRIIIKLGFSEGPCIALTLNDKLDYFGSTVNRANRVQDQSHGGDMVLPQRVFRSAAVQRVLEREGARGIRVRSEDFVATLKGFSEKLALCRLRENDKIHPSPCGAFLEPCVIVRLLTGGDPRGSKWLPPEGVTEAQARILRSASYEVGNHS
jgi:hypothetical protein